VNKTNRYEESILVEKEGQPILRDIYQVFWPDHTWIDDVRGKDPQLYGLDHIVHFKGNNTETVQAKIRLGNWDDILLEYISNDVTNLPGWMESPMLCNHFFVLMMAGNICYWFHFPSLRNAWNKYKSEWIKLGEQYKSGFGKRIAKNPGYNTVSVTVPLKILYKEVPLYRIFRKEGPIWK